jgi:hypothetical protein
VLSVTPAQTTYVTGTTITLRPQCSAGGVVISSSSYTVIDWTINDQNTFDTFNCSSSGLNECAQTLTATYITQWQISNRIRYGAAITFNGGAYATSTAQTAIGVNGATTPTNAAPTVGSFTSRNS